MLRALLDQKLVDFIALDVKTSLETYPELVGPGIRPAHIVESIKLIRDSGTEYEFRATLIKEHHTEPVLEAMERLLSGAARISLQRFRPEQTLSPLFADFHAFSVAEMATIAERFRSTGGHVSLRG